MHHLISRICLSALSTKIQLSNKASQNARSLLVLEAMYTLTQLPTVDPASRELDLLRWVGFHGQRVQHPAAKVSAGGSGFVQIQRLPGSIRET